MAVRRVTPKLAAITEPTTEMALWVKPVSREADATWYLDSASDHMTYLPGNFTEIKPFQSIVEVADKLMAIGVGPVTIPLNLVDGGSSIKLQD